MLSEGGETNKTERFGGYSVKRFGLLRQRCLHYFVVNLYSIK